MLGTTSVFSALLLAVSGVMFAGSVQAGFERIWSLPAGPWHKIWRQLVWLSVLTAYIYAEATVGTAMHGGLAATAAVAVVLGIPFFWWGPCFLLGGRVGYRAAVPGAVATIAGLSGLRVFSTLVFEPLIASNAASYGALGTVLIVQSWLIGVGWVIYGGQLFGRWFHDAWLRGLRQEPQEGVTGAGSAGGLRDQGVGGDAPVRGIGGDHRGGRDLGDRQAGRGSRPGQVGAGKEPVAERVLGPSRCLGRDRFGTAAPGTAGRGYDSKRWAGR